MTWKTFFHLIGVIHFFYGCYYDYMYVKIPVIEDGSLKIAESPYGGKFRFLTFLDAILLMVYFIVAFLNDLIGVNEPRPTEKPFIRKAKDNIFSTLAFPVAMFVASTFWALYAVDRELIFPQKMDAFFPAWLNHLMHTNIVIFVFIELVTSFRMFPLQKVGISVLGLFTMAYITWVHIIYVKSGAWVYPVLAVINLPLRIVFFLCSFILMCALYHLGEVINRNVWSKEIELTLKSRKKKAQ